MKERIKANRKRENDLAAIERIRITELKWASLVKVIHSLVKWIGCPGIISFMLYLSIDSLSGKVTSANINVSIDLWEQIKNSLADVATSCVSVGILGIIFGVGGIIFGRKCLQLKNETVEKLHQYQVKWEKQHDPKRTSSKLTPRGETRPEDE